MLSYFYIRVVKSTLRIKLQYVTLCLHRHSFGVVAIGLMLSSLGVMADPQATISLRWHKSNHWCWCTATGTCWASRQPCQFCCKYQDMKLHQPLRLPGCFASLQHTPLGTSVCGTLSAAMLIPKAWPPASHVPRARQQHMNTLLPYQIQRCVCRLQEAELAEAAVAATVKLSREQHTPIRLAAARATGNLLIAELEEQLPADTAMEPLIPVLVALLGQDQTSEVQRQGLQVCYTHLVLEQPLQHTYRQSYKLCSLHANQHQG